MSSYNVMEATADGALRPATRELVEPATAHVRIRVQACGICHTDGMTVLDPQAPSRVPGHEVVGTIDAVGPGVAGWNVGQRVGVGFLGGQCGVCEQCRRGNFVACSDQDKTGVTIEGGYAEILYARATGLVSIPDEMSSVDAAPLLCAGLTTFNGLRKAKLGPGELVGIQGIGGLGHLGIQYAVKTGLRVAAIARGSAKEALARELGAHYYIDSTAGDPGEQLAKLGGAAAVIATASDGDLSPLINGLAVGGRLVVVGASQTPVQATFPQLIFGDVTIGGSITGRSIENEDNLRFAAQQDVKAMIEARPLGDAEAAFQHMLSGAARFRVVLTV
jgi:alcohol dehydrogenase, propanol-preferring